MLPKGPRAAWFAIGITAAVFVTAVLVQRSGGHPHRRTDAVCETAGLPGVTPLGDELRSVAAAAWRTLAVGSARDTG